MTNRTLADLNADIRPERPTDWVEDDAPKWSAHHLPEPRATRSMSFAFMAVAAGVVAIVLATTLSAPIKTEGSKMEPMRFQSMAQK